MRVFDSPDELARATGESFGPTEWQVVDQAQVDMFGDATGDRQWIHVDPERAASGPFGGTIAHGLLTLSLLPDLLGRLYTVEKTSMGVNYGFNKVRFPAPVPVGARVRMSATLSGVRDEGTFVEAVVTSVLEVEGSQKPACVAESIGRVYR
ncbi:MULTISPECIES: MaoC family dehydratase [unclassified Pseudonocardia]|uniref:MaoC family dehydratase n=1 Tax=unclassified Pseudonocardia TaxID=2619320 RepID=UPI0001FFDDF0|nr:MaoC family dehydratase [Pseudonocardia sp. Ae707_Ps1]OLM16780.1 putative nodulation protein N, MaoC family [Pseudonocardia sp. Ae707_Ps1]